MYRVTSLFLSLFLLAVCAVPVSAHVGVVVVETIDAEDAEGNTIAGCPKAVRISRLGHTHHGTDGSGYVFITTRKGDRVVGGQLASSSVPAARLRYRNHHDSITYSAGLQASRPLSFRLRCGFRYCGPSTVGKTTDASRADAGTVLTLPFEWFAATLRHDRNQGAAWPFPTLHVSADTEIAHHDLARIAVAVGNTNGGESWTQNRTTIERAIPKEYVQFERDGGTYYRFDPVFDYGAHDRKHVASQSASIRIPLVGGRMDDLPACIKAITKDTSLYPGFYTNIDITELGVWSLRWVSTADGNFQRRGINAAPTPLPLVDFDFERFLDGSLSTVERPMVAFYIGETGRPPSGIAIAGEAARRLIAAAPSPTPAPVVAPTPTPTPWPTPTPTTVCQFVLGFATLRDLIGHDIVGDCLENERYAANGNSEQRTTGGLLVWRKSDNWTAFTDGYRTWINGPNGLVQRLNTERFEWEADYAPGGGIATPTLLARGRRDSVL